MGAVDFASSFLPRGLINELSGSRILTKSNFAISNVGSKKLATGLGTARGVADNSRALVSSSRWLYRGNRLISQTILQPVPIPKAEGPWGRGLLELIGDILSGMDLHLVLEPWVDGLSIEECNKIMVEVGKRDWSLAMDLFKFFKDRSPCIQKASPSKEKGRLGANAEGLTVNRGSSGAEGFKASGLLKAYTTLIGVLSRKGRLAELGVLLHEIEQEELEPDLRFYNGVAEAYSNFGMVPNVSEVLVRMEESGVQPDSSTYESMIAACLRAKVPQLDVALQMFRSMTRSKLEVSAKTYLKLIDACVESHDLNAGEEIFLAMRSTALQIYSKTWVKMIQLHANAGSYKKAEELFRAMRAVGVSPTASIYDALLLAYCQAGCLDQAFSVFREYKLTTKPSLVAYNYLIDASGKRGRYEESLALYTELSNNGLRPSTVTYTSLICAMVEAGQNGKADRLYKKMLQKNLVPSGHTITAMIHAYTCCGWTRLGHEICSKLKDYKIEMNTVVYGAMLKLYVQGRWYREAAYVVKQMEARGMEPDMAGYGVLIAALGEVGEEIAPLANALQASDWEPCEVASFLVSAPSRHDSDAAGGERDLIFERASSFFEDWSRLRDRNANRSLYNALMDALWRRGFRRRAQLVMQKARDLLPWYNRPRNGATSFLDLRGLSVGGAQVALLDWLQEAGTNCDHGEMGRTMIVRTGGGESGLGRSVGKKGRGLGAVKQAVSAYLEELCSPFREAPELGPGRLLADSKLVVEWLSKQESKDALRLHDYG